MLTLRQKQLKDFIDKVIVRDGIAPTEREIAKRFKISPSTTHEHLTALQQKGYLEKARGRARGMRVVDFTPDLSLSYGDIPLNQIVCGDAVEIMRTMPSDLVDLVVTSPPYDELRAYHGYSFNFDAIARGLFRVIKKGGILVWVVGDKINKGNRSFTSFKQALSFQGLGFNAHDVMIYKKKNTPFMRSNAYTNCYEFMFVFSKGSPKTFNPLKTRTVRHGQEMLPFNKKADGVNKKTKAELKPEKTLTNIWDYAVGYGGSTSDKIAFQHTAIFPEKLAEDHILSWTNPGDIVFDPMCGSGTTCKMAALNGRSYIGCDISEKYVDLAKKRMAYHNL